MFTEGCAWHCSEPFTCINLFNPHSAFEINALLICIFQPGNRHREVKYIAQGHTASEWQSWEVNSHSLAPELFLLPARPILPQSGEEWSLPIITQQRIF